MHWIRPGTRLSGALCALLVLAACGVDGDQVRLCERIIGAFEEHPNRIAIVRVASHPNAASGVIIDYRTVEADAPAAASHAPASGEEDDDEGSDHWVSCRFEREGMGLWFDRPQLTEVASDRAGTLTGVDLQMLRIWLRLSKDRDDGAKPVIRKRLGATNSPAVPRSTAWARSAGGSASP